MAVVKLREFFVLMLFQSFKVLHDLLSIMLSLSFYVNLVPEILFLIKLELVLIEYATDLRKNVLI